MAGAATDIVGTAGIDIIPVTTLFHNRLKAQILPGADKLGRDLGQAIARTMTIEIASAIPKAVSDGSKVAKAIAVRQGSSTGGAFADSLRAKLEAAFRAMPKLDIGLSDTGVDAQLARLRAKLEDLRNKRIGIDLSVTDAEAKLQDIDDRLARLGASSPNVAVRVDVATARAAIADIRAEIDEASRNPLDIRVRIGEFRTNLIAQVEAAQASLPAIEITADTDPARRELDRYRAELEAIPNRLRTDANFDDAAAVARIEELRLNLDRLAARRVDVDVRADAARASAELAVVGAEVEALDAKRVNIGVDTSSARGSVLALGVALASLAAPALPVIAAGAGAIVSAFTAATASVGAFALAAAPGIKNVVAAMQAQTAAANSTRKATSAQANAGVTAAQQALTMAGAEQALASARRSAATSIANAEDGVTRAERSLTDAQKAEKQAQDDLTAARKDAADQLAALDSQLANSALDQRAAQLSVDEAKAALDAANAPNSTATALQRRQAQLDYDTAVQRLKDQTQKTKDLQASAAAERKAGIEGSDVVKQAEDKLAQAHRNTADQAAALAKAQTAVGDAEAQAADSIRSAQRGIESARLSASKVTVQAATKEDAYQKALSRLSPTARDLFDAIAGPRGLKSAFSDWSKTLQPEVLPLFTRGVESAKTSLPGLTPLVLTAADGLGKLYDKASAELKTPFWSGFKQDIKTSAEPALIGLGVAFGNVFKGMAGVVDAFLPHMQGIAANMDRITGRFANWGSNLKGSPGFEAFLEYVKENGPRVAQYIGQILTIVTDVGRDIQPVTEAFLGPLLNGLEWMAENMPEVIQLVYALYLGSKLLALGWGAVAVAVGIFDTAMTIASLETWSFAAALAATGISEIILLIEAAVVVLALGLYELWTRAGWFRDGLKAAWKGIEVASMWMWKVVLKPTFDAIATAFVAVGDAAVWLWKNAIKPAWDAIQLGARYLITALLTILITPFYIVITQVLAPVVLWLWTHAFKPSFEAIGGAAGWLWKNALKPAFDAIGKAWHALYVETIKPTADGFKLALKGTGDAGSWLWTHALKPAYDAISGATKTLWNVGVKPWFDQLKKGVGLVATAFDLAKQGIQKSWSQLSGIAKTPVKFIVDHVYNEGIEPVWNAVAKITGVKTLGKVDTSKWATGGVLPGYTPGRDPHQFYSPTGGRLELSGGEAILRPEVTAAIGAPFVYAINAIAQRRGVSGVKAALGGSHAYFGGGIVDWLGSTAGDVAGFAKSAFGTVKDLASYAANPTKIWDDLAKQIKAQTANLGTTEWAHMLAKFPLGLVDGLKNKAVSLVHDVLSAKAGGGDTGAHGSGPAAAQAMARGMLKAWNWGTNMMAPLLKLWNGESGWRWNALNASSGAYGIPQALPATKMASAGPDWRTNPRTQMTWGLDYIASRYGSPANAWSQWLARSPHWYDDGGYLMPGVTPVINGTGKPEAVFTSSQWETLRANVQGRGSAPTVNVNTHTYVGTRELTDIVDERIDVHTDQWATDLAIGRTT